ncbi:ABC transporter substrate-binding protein [Streptomyces sp. NPDC096311]|uniref:ABC transporter substrate-binding protein n=1 Tax=Streptomyces sp. NPDC096311 TaxID=3366083 RepID=UPI00381532B7
MSSESQMEDRLPSAKGDVAHIDWGLPQGEPNTLDPASAQDYGEIQVMSNLCDTLLRMNPDFSISPNLASFKQPDPKTIVYRLKHGVKFWDGTEMTSADVAYSINRARSPKSTLGELISSIKSVKATGKYEVTVRLSRADKLVSKQMAGIAGAVYEADYAKRAGSKFGSASGGVMCSGPFKLAKWKAGSGIELTRNEVYWNPTYRAHAKTVSFKFLSDSVALAQTIAAREIDGAYEVPPAILPRLSQISSGSLHYGRSFGFVELNVMRPDGPLANLALRKALFGVIEREGIARSIYHGSAEANYTLAAKNTWDPEAKELWEAAYPKWVRENKLDVDTAKALVKQAGGGAKPIVLVIEQGNETMSLMAQLIQQDAEGIGLNVEIRPMTQVQIAELRDSPGARKGIDLLIGAAAGIVGDTQENVPYYVGSGSYYNYTHYKNPRVDKLMAQAQDSLDPKRRARLLIEAQDLYEPARVTTDLLTTSTILYLDKRLTGATVSYSYVYEPSLALIGSAE